MSIDPSTPLTPVEELVFGVDARRHAVLGFLLEQGSGALPENEQAELHCRMIEEAEGRAAGDAMRKKLAEAARLKAHLTGLVNKSSGAVQ